LATYFLTSERIGFREWRADDEALIRAIWGDPEVTRFSGGPFTDTQVLQRLADEIANLRAHAVQYWPIFRRDDGAHLGCCGLRPRTKGPDEFELGFHLRRDAWGRGYALEAARAIIAWAPACGASSLMAGHHPDNHASGKLLLKLGFVHYGDEYYPPTGLIEPCYRLVLAS
jgi:RimJ/RimL family protein N-acetyltransferase